MRIVLPLIKSELLSLVKFHKGKIKWNKHKISLTKTFLGSVPDDISKDLLPSEFGGEALSVDILHEQSMVMLRDYNVWLKDSEYFKSYLIKKPKKSGWWGWNIFSGSNTNNNHETSNLKDLQID